MKNKFLRRLSHLRHPFYTIRQHRSWAYETRSASLDDKDFICGMYKICFGRKIDLENPKTFNEKLQWLKLYDRRPIYTTMVDKIAVKEYVSSRIGTSFLAKEIGQWEKFEDIDFSKLPSQFVLKTNHGSGGVFVCKDKDSFDPSTISESFTKALKENYYYHCREWPYKNVKPMVFAEELLKDPHNDVLPVYKFFCFGGEPYIAQIIQNDKHPNESIDYVDMSYTRLKIKQNFPNSKSLLPKPDNWEDMKAICRKLTSGIPFVRCDLYSIEGKIFFSEFTFYSDAGFQRFHPAKWDKILGDKIILPTPKTAE